MVLYQKFGEWTLMKTEPIRRTKKNVFYLVQCSCGNFGEVSPSYLKKGESTRCRQCANKRFHDKYINPPHKPFKYRGNPTNNSWRSMIQRCTNPTNNRYYIYGARGIKVCDKWLKSFENFLKDMGERPKGKQLDRIFTNGDYCPENCRWVTAKENSRNRNVRAFIIPGTLFEDWKVIEIEEDVVPQHYLCECICGIRKIIRGSTLKAGLTKRCNDCRIKMKKNK